MKTYLSSGKTIAAVTLLAASLTFVACNKSSNEPPTASLHERLGGTAAIASVVDTFLVEVLADTVINARFNTLPPSRVAALRTNLINQICAGTGGPCTYTGRSMMDAHAGMNIPQAEFNALVGDLVTSLNKHNVPTAEKEELLAILGPMQSDIVNK